MCNLNNAKIFLLFPFWRVVTQQMSLPYICGLKECTFFLLKVILICVFQIPKENSFNLFDVDVSEDRNCYVLRIPQNTAIKEREGTKHFLAAQRKPRFGPTSLFDPAPTNPTTIQNHDAGPQTSS